MPRMSVDLVCPRCKGALADEAGERVCCDCGARYPVAVDVPVLLPDALSAQHEHQRRYFDAEFARYGSYVVENWRRSYIDKIFDAVGVLNGNAPYLDVGVGGSGATVIEAARHGAEAVGVDLSVPGVLTAKQFAADEGVDPSFAVCAAEALPFPDAAFGSASAVALLEHLDDERPALDELARVLRGGGLVWLMVPHAFKYMPPPVWPVYWWHDRRIGHKRHYDEARLKRVADEAGFEHVATFFSAHPVKLLQAAASRVLPALRRPDSRWWWKLERFDERASQRALGALHLSGVFRRKP